VGCVGGGPEIADGLHSASLPRTAQMNPLGKRGGLPWLLSISVLWAEGFNQKNKILTRLGVKETDMGSPEREENIAKESSEFYNPSS
jgi:hypothetical protein